MRFPVGEPHWIERRWCGSCTALYPVWVVSGESHWIERRLCVGRRSGRSRAGVLVTYVGRRVLVAGARMAGVASARALLEGWTSLPLEHRRELLRHLVREVRVWLGASTRVEIVERWGS